jgi:high-affinity iron transporter
VRDLTPLTHQNRNPTPILLHDTSDTADHSRPKNQSRQKAGVGKRYSSGVIPQICEGQVHAPGGGPFPLTNGSLLRAQYCDAFSIPPIPTAQTEELGFLEPRPALGAWVKGTLAAAAACVLGVLAWQGIAAHGVPDPVQGQTSTAGRFLDISVLVFREGLECVLVLSAITANMIGSQRAHQKPVALGVGVGFLATGATWFVAIGILNSLTESVSALNLQAATGLLTVIVLLIVMNWFFHKMYWGGWICLHTRKKKELIKSSDRGEVSRTKLLLGLGLLGFSSFYREGFEVVLFLQSYRLKLGTNLVLLGTLFGAFLTAIVAVLTFIAHRKLPYRKMLVSAATAPYYLHIKAYLLQLLHT